MDPMTAQGPENNQNSLEGKAKQEIKDQIEAAVLHSNILPDAQAATLKDRFDSVEQNATQAAADVAARDPNTLSRSTIEGTITDSNSLKYKYEVTQIHVQEFIDILRNNEEIRKKLLDKLNPTCRSILINIINLERRSSNVDLMSSPIVYKLLYALVNNQVNESNLFSILTPEDFNTLKQINKTLFDSIAQALIDAKGGLKSNIVDQLKTYKPEPHLQEEEEQRRQAEAAAAAAIEGHTPDMYERSSNNYLLSILKDEIERKLVNSIQSAEAFKNFLAEYVHIVKKREPGKTQEYYNETASREIATILMRLINRIYEPVLSTPPREEQRFDSVANIAVRGGFNSPNSAYANLLSRIRELKQDKTALTLNMGELKFYTPGRVSHTEFNEHTGRIETWQESTPDYLPTHDMYDYFTFMETLATTERSFLAFGYDFQELVARKDRGEQGFFGNLAAYANRLLKSYDIDEIKALPNWHMVQAALMAMETYYVKAFADENFQKDPKVIDRFFKNYNAPEQSVVDFLKHHFPDQDLPMIYRSIYIARVIFNAVYFRMLEIGAYVDPKFQENTGEVSLRGGDVEILSSFDQEYLAKKYHGTETQTNGGLAFLAYNINIPDYNHEELIKAGEEAWEDSFEGGQMGKLGTYMAPEGESLSSAGQMFIETINQGKQGGVVTQSGWRIFYAYRESIRELLYHNNERLNFKKKDSLVHGWKLIENIGIDAVKNYQDNLLLGRGDFSMFDLEGMEKAQGVDVKEITERYTEFLEFLYDKYFSSESKIGNELIGHKSKEDILKELAKKMQTLQRYHEMGEQWGRNEQKRQIEIEKAKKDASDYVKKFSNQARMVMMFERMPLQYLLMEKKRLSENGLTLMSQLQQYFLVGAPPEDRFQIHDDRDESRRVNQFDDAIDDLNYVQVTMRMNTIDEMRKLKKDKEINNLYGDLSQLRSQVDYRITSERIKALLEARIRMEKANQDREDKMKQGIKDPPKVSPDSIELSNDDKNRIKRAVLLYEKMQEGLLDVPPESEWERSIGHHNEEKAEVVKEYRKRKLLSKRIIWWDKFLLANTGGFSLTSSELALEFLDLAAAGPETVVRSADGCHSVSEFLSTQRSKLHGVLIETLDSNKLEPALKYLEEMKETVESSSGEATAVEITSPYIKRVLYFFRRDRQASSAIGEILHAKGENSIAGKFTGKYKTRGKPWERDTIAHFIDELVVKKVMPTFTNRQDEQKVDVTNRYFAPDSIVGKINKRLGGRIKIYKRQFAKEVSGEAMKALMDSGFGKLMLHEVLPRFFIGLAIIMLILGAAGAKEMDIV